jgi:DUF1365 family protein
MNSCLYHGLVRHSRYRPRRHAFRYRLFQFFLDLDEVDSVLDRLWFCSSRRPAPIRFRRRDHLGDSQQSLKEAVHDKVRELGGPVIDGKVCLLTNLRYFGYGFNPVSFYFCYDRDQVLRAILAEVNNTPWGEQHCYLIPVKSEQRFIRHQQDKAFHVSPFMDLDMTYQWTLSHPDERLLVQIENQQAGERLFDAALVMKRKTLDNRHVMQMMLSYPLMTFKVIGAIYFEALRLWLKKVPFYAHSKIKEAPAVANK